MAGGAKGIVHSFGQCLLDIIFPKYCLSCGREGTYLCVGCKIRPLTPWNGRLEFSGETYFNHILCAADYEDELVSKLIKACKYHFVKELTQDLGYYAAKELEKSLISKNSIFGEDFFKAVVVPVPLSSRREAWRGFNQAGEIAQYIANYFNLEYSEALVRLKHKTPQAKLTEAERLLNMSGCFKLSGGVPERVILVDDVITTGATLNECAKILKSAGTKEVCLLAVAKG